MGSFKKLFGPEAQNYTKYRLPYPPALFDFLLTKIPNDSQRILDLACGTGKSTEELVKTGLEITGCDHDDLMIAEAKSQAQLKNLNINYIVGEAENLNFADNYFDVVTVGTAFHFFVNEKAMTEIRRVLKPRGLLFVYWTLTTKDVPEEDQIAAAIFQKYNWQKVPAEFRDLATISNFFKQADFSEVSTEVIPIKFEATVDERVGLQTTSGSYELLSSDEKESFLAEVREDLVKKLRDRHYFTLEEEIQICLGFKS